MKINDRLPGFAEGTKVLMADGKVKNIETIKSGDYVLSFKENDAFAPLEKKRVLDIFKRVDRNVLEIKARDSDITIKCAPGQLFIGPGDDWKVAPERSDLIDGEGNVHEIEVSKITRGKHLIYDLVVEDNHSLVANGVRVHNMLYSYADVVAGRQLASIDPGPVSNYYRKDDSENSNIYYTNGSKKKKSRKKRDSRPQPKISGTLTAAKLLSSINDIIDPLSELVEETPPNNLAILRLSVQSSIDSLFGYIQAFASAVFVSEVSAFDKSELTIMAADMLTAASAARNPFVKPNLTTSDKNEALSQLTLLELLIARSKAKFDLYLGPTTEDKNRFDVEVNGKRTIKSNKKTSKNSRAANGAYREGGSRNDFGSDKGRGGNLGNGPGQTRSTNPAGPGSSPRDKAKTGSSGPPKTTGGGPGVTAGAPGGDADKAAKGSNSTRGGLGGSSSGAGTRNSSNFCFAYGTQFKMADGSVKSIQDIQIGDNMLVGGKVLTTIISDGTLEDWYVYNGIKLTGAHPVLNKDGKWRKVCETANAAPTTSNDRTYILINENHKLVAHNGEIFTDYLMVGMENKLRAELYYRDFDNLFRLLNNESVMKD